MVGGYIVSMIGYVVVSVSIGVVVEFRQYIGLVFYVVQNVIVMVVVKGIVVIYFYIGEGQMCSGLVVRFFGVICLNVVFLLCVVGYYVVDLGFVFEI